MKTKIFTMNTIELREDLAFWEQLHKNFERQLWQPSKQHFYYYTLHYKKWMKIIISRRLLKAPILPRTFPAAQLFAFTRNLSGRYWIAFQGLLWMGIDMLSASSLLIWLICLMKSFRVLAWIRSRETYLEVWSYRMLGLERRSTISLAYGTFSLTVRVRLLELGV